MSPQAWAGLKLTPLANRAWLNSLEQRLKWQPEAAGSLQRDGPLDWSALTFTDEGPRWRRSGGEATRLWRARSSFGHWSWAWCVEGHAPSSGDFVSLRDDDASRTVFALARNADRPIFAVLVRDGDRAFLRLRQWLPRAEYRYLAMLATPSKVERDFQWTIPATRVEDVLETLRCRLGLVTTEEAPA